MWQVHGGSGGRKPITPIRSLRRELLLFFVKAPFDCFKLRIVNRTQSRFKLRIAAEPSGTRAQHVSYCDILLVNNAPIYMTTIFYVFASVSLVSRITLGPRSVAHMSLQAANVPANRNAKD